MEAEIDPAGKLGRLGELGAAVAEDIGEPVVHVQQAFERDLELEDAAPLASTAAEKRRSLAWSASSMRLRSLQVQDGDSKGDGSSADAHRRVADLAGRDPRRGSSA
jgi:hypothetical protein